MTDHKQRTISYLRAVWPQGIPVTMTLESCMRHCLQRFPNADDSRLSLADRLAETRHRETRTGYLFLHIASWTDGEEASTVPHLPATPTADLSVQSPGVDSNFLDGDGMVLIASNHCLLMPSGMDSRSIKRYLHLLITKARENGGLIPDEMDRFDLLSIANDHAVQEVFSKGVKKIHMNIGQYMETAKQNNYIESEWIVQRLGREVLSTLVLADEDRRRIEEAENVHAKLTISIDTRKAGLKPEELTPIARQAASESEEDIEFETVDGTRVKAGQLILKKTVSIRAFAKTVHHQHAWEEMEVYFRELNNNRALEQ